MSSSLEGPTIRRMVVGSFLRRLREEKGITREKAGDAIRGSESKISRMELGRVSFKGRDIADLLALYGIPEGADREAVLTMAREANDPGWWQAFDDAFPAWFQNFIGMEAAALLIRSYEATFIPGLLQTEDYARAVFMSLPHAVESVERRLAVRIQRQALLFRDEPPTFWTVIEEATVRRPVGGHRVMQAQLRHLLTMMERPRVIVQIMPFGIGVHPALGSEFQLLRFAEQALPDVVFLEHLAGAQYLDRTDVVERYTAAMARLSSDAQTPDQTADMLESLLRET